MKAVVPVQFLHLGHNFILGGGGRQADGLGKEAGLLARSFLAAYVRL